MISGKITAVLADVDGVLTSNHLTFGNDVPEKIFNVLDGHGVVLLRKHTIFCAFITGRDDLAMQQRAAALKVDWHLAGAGRDKGTIVLEVMAQQNLNPDNVVFVGDDVTDLKAFDVVGWPVAVADARQEVRRAARRVTRAAGGAGAFREVVDWVLSAS